MAKPRGINQKAKWRAHSIRLAKYADRVLSVYDALNKEIAAAVVKTSYDGSEPFRFSDYPMAKKRFEEVQAEFVKDLRTLIYTGTSDEWRESNIVQDLLADKVLKFYGVKKNAKKYKVYYQTNSDALKAFKQRKEDGMGLSERIWNQSKNYKEEMEYAISSAIEKGTSAVKLSKRLSKYLQDFPLLKHDYKEKYGTAVKCQDCEYRSIRLARSEVNMAYRTAEQERWKQFDFVLGYEVKLTQNGRHKPDICDELAGKYPKDFVFKGWHPNCMCYAIPILKTEEQFFNDEDASDIVEPPKNFTDWLEKNAERIADAERRDTLPYWISDNSDFIRAGSIIESPVIPVAKPVDNAIDMIGRMRSDYAEKCKIEGAFNISRILPNFNWEEWVSDYEKLLEDYDCTLSRFTIKDGFGQSVNAYLFGEYKGQEFYIQRTFVRAEDKLIAKHDRMDLPEELQGRGFCKRFLADSYKQYVAAGIDEISLVANITVGGYCWGKYGFYTDRSSALGVATKDEAIPVSKVMKGVINAFYSSHKEDELFPMRLLSDIEGAKEYMMGSKWFGELNIKDKAKSQTFIEYLFGE